MLHTALMADESDGRNGTGQLSPNNSPRRHVDIVALVLGIAASIGGLLDISGKTGRVVLLLIGTAFLLVAFARLTHRRTIAVNRQLTAALEAKQAVFQQYVDAILRTIDRESPLFEDRLVITVIIGEDDASDRVIERWCTTPRPRMAHRAIRPIVPTHDDRVTRLDELEFKCSIDNGGNRITALPLVERSRYLRVWLLFEPPQTTPVAWQATYTPRGLWRPLRDKGIDQLAWEDRLPTARGSSSLAEVEVHFLFPATFEDPGVVERHDLGTTGTPIRLQNGQWQITWRDPSPARHRYVWELTRRS
jgi:hypothetical protein